MDSGRYALPNCPHCAGKGSITTRRPDGSQEYRLCLCTFLGQRQHVASLLLRELFPGRAAEMTFSTFQTGGEAENELALQVARNFVDDWQTACARGWTLGFWGAPRAGKTHLATAIAIALLRRYLTRSMVLSVPQLLRAERATFRERGASSPIDAAANVALLVLDDLGAEYLRTRSQARSEVDWVDEQLYVVLNERVMHQRPTIYTTNLSPTDLERTLSERVWSRIDRSQVGSFELVRVGDVGRPSAAERSQLLRGTALEGTGAA